MISVPILLSFVITNDAVVVAILVGDFNFDSVLKLMGLEVLFWCIKMLKSTGSRFGF